jgi:hypothetical protein
MDAELLERWRRFGKTIFSHDVLTSEVRNVDSSVDPMSMIKSLFF